MKIQLVFLFGVALLSAELHAGGKAMRTKKKTYKEMVAVAVQKRLLDPLKKRERKRKSFSRGASRPVDRRVRVIDNKPSLDSQGKRFLRFVIDARWGTEWDKKIMEGCLYLDTGATYLGDFEQEEFRPAKYLLGKKTKKAKKGVCVSAPPKNT